MIKKITVSISIILFSILVGVIVIEVAVRVFNMESDFFYESDTCVGYKLMPNKSGYSVRPEYRTFVESNSEGFRDIDHEVGDSDRFRILMLGDSFTEGRQVDLESTFFRKVEEKFNLIEEDVEVISLGVAGYGTNNSLQALKCYGLKYDPDLVILNFFNGNDIFDNYFRQSPHNLKFYLKEGVLVLDESYNKRTESIQNTFMHRLFTSAESNLFSFRFISSKILISEEGLKNILRYLAEIYHKEYDERWNNAWDLTEALILEIKMVAEENNADFITMQIPSFVEFPEKRKNKKESNIYNFKKPREIVSDFTKTNNIKYIDLFSVFIDNDVSFDDAHFVEDHHFNERGHDIVSDVIVEYILENNMLHE